MRGEVVEVTWLKNVFVFQAVEITATSWVTCSFCSVWSAGWCTAAFPVSRQISLLSLKRFHMFEKSVHLCLSSWLNLCCLLLFLLRPDWRIHCATSYAKDGFWLYLTQIASCSPWMFWMFLNSVFHFMWVAVLIMCQLYQVWVHFVYTKYHWTRRLGL